MCRRTCCQKANSPRSLSVDFGLTHPSQLLPQVFNCKYTFVFGVSCARCTCHFEVSGEDQGATWPCNSLKLYWELMARIPPTHQTQLSQ